MNGDTQREQREGFFSISNVRIGTINTAADRENSSTNAFLFVRIKQVTSGQAQSFAFVGRQILFVSGKHQV